MSDRIESLDEVLWIGRCQEQLPIHPEAPDTPTGQPEPLDLEDLDDDLAQPDFVNGRFFLCCVCGQEPVDAEHGFDTCNSCLAKR